MKTTPKHYAEALDHLLNKKLALREVCKELANLLVLRGESGKVNDIERAYETFRSKRNNEVIAQVVGGQPLPGQVFSKEFQGKKIREEHRIDEAQIAGVRIRIGDSLIDNTIAHRLRDLKNALR